MTLWAHVYGGYASYENAYPWGDGEHVAHKFVQLLKGEVANGYGWLPRATGPGKLKISTPLRHNAFAAFGEWGGAIANQLYPDGAWLVPVPSSSCLSVGQDPKGRALAAAIAARSASRSVDALHWHIQLPSARSGGPRDAETLFANVRARTDLAKRPVVLVDDVVTGGGHAIACARALRALGHEVEHVIAGARTVKSPPVGGMFAIADWDLEANPFAGIFG
ncbi:phosphoribosyltransferase [Sphingomonas beigongshangi]|uniref:phosphoribosyltransferase n=1 Tax=Sphingomonas beigongshangi TaxID=2782540 RepID=UPI00193C4133|nr:phosphoribosyltransferase [Sphingomonas beigongshangi]